MRTYRAKFMSYLYRVFSALLISSVFMVTPSQAENGGLMTALQDWADGITLNGYVKNETAYRFREPRSFTKIRNILYLKTNVPFGDVFEFTASGWGYYDHAFDLFNYYTIAARSERDALQPLNFIENLPEEEDTKVAEIREFYLDILLDNMDIRIGKQFVVWGVMTGVRIVDEINPMNFRELILPDLLDYRVPLWTLKLNYFGENTDYELLWIPDIQFHKPALPGSEWELLQEVPGTTFPETFVFDNSEVGIKVSRTIWDTEVSFSYFYTWDDFPVIFRQVPVNIQVVDGEVADPVFFPTYTRMEMYGTTMQRTLFGQVIKGELAYVKGKFFGIGIVDDDQDGFIDLQGEIQKDHIRWGIGMDFNVWKTDFSPGLVQWIILDYDDVIIQDPYDSSFNLFVRKELPEHGAVFQLLAIYMITLDELYLKPKVIFNVSDHFQIAAGMDLFWGKRSQTGVAARDGRSVDLVEIEQQYQFIGNFNNNDRIFLEFKYGF